MDTARNKQNDDGVLAELDTKTHQQRRVTLDPETIAVLNEHQERIARRLQRAGYELAEDSFVFSGTVNHSRFLTPSAVTQRYERLVAKLGIRTTVHKLRHYSATELIKAGVDINTVAGRLGHGGGGTTTLKYYAGWVAEAEQRAAISLGARMPERKWTESSAAERVQANPRSPYEVVACAVRETILAGAYADGDPAPTVKELVAEHGVSAGTAHRALELLKAWHLLTGGGRGNRYTVVVPPEPVPAEPTEPTDEPVADEALDLELVHLGRSVRTYCTEADPTDTAQLLGLLTDAIRRVGGDTAEPADYELVVRYAGERGVVTTVVAAPRMPRHSSAA